MTVNFAKMPDWIEISFGVVGRVGQKNDLLDRGQYPPQGRANFGEGKCSGAV